MAEPEEPQEQGFEILEALAKISARDFRLGQFMADIGLDPNQSNLFYRQLIREAKEFKTLMDIFEQNIDTGDRTIKNLKAQLSAKEEQLRTLTTKLHTLQNGTRQKTDSLEKERQSLLAAKSELQGEIWKYNALIELLSGEMKPTTLKAISELFWDAHTKAQYGRIEGRPPPDPATLEKIRQELRQELRDILRVPPEEWEKKLATRDAKIEELEKRCQALAVVNLVEYHQVLKDKKPDETEEPQENFMEYLQDLADKRRNETDRGEGRS